jgi:hypothetical protein
MAMLPCDNGYHRTLGRNTNVYIGVIGDSDPQRWSLRLCDLHWGEIEPHLAKYEVLVEDPTFSVRALPDWCASDGEPIHERGRQVFVTAYPPKQGRKDYWLHIHESCTLPRFIPKEPSRAGA